MKINISTEKWVELYCEIAQWHLETLDVNSLIQEDNDGNITYTNKGQIKLEQATNAIESILEEFFVKAD